MAGTQNSSPERDQLINDGNIIRKNIPRMFEMVLFFLN